MSTPSCIAVHFGQKEAGATVTGEPVMVDQRVYIGHKRAGLSIAITLAAFLDDELSTASDEDITAQLAMRVTKEFGDGLTLAPYPVTTEHPVLVLDITNEAVWVEDRAGEPIEGRAWDLPQFMGLDSDQVRAAMED